MKKILICALIIALSFLVSCDFSTTLEEFSNNMMKTVTDAAGDYLRETSIPGEESSPQEASSEEESSSSDEEHSSLE